jgi:enamine deaminase RidA (YjgF/YER057c/UK114 family)
MLTVHVLDRLYRHSSHVAHGVEVPAGARLLLTNGQVGTKPDGTTPETAAAQAEVAFERLREVLKAARMGLGGGGEGGLTRAKAAPMRESYERSAPER